MEIVIILLILLFIVGLIHIISAFTKDKMIEYVKIDLNKESLVDDLIGYKIVFITDVHSMSLNKIRKEVEYINQQSVDLVLLGGDFPHRNKAEAPLEILNQIEAKDGFYGVLGNHDRYSTLSKAMAEQSMTLLLNDGEEVRKGLFIAGVEDLKEGIPDVSKAVSSANQRDCIILLSHNPDVAMEQDTKGIDLILSGHTHGGEITFFGKIAPALSWTKHVTNYGRRFQGGWAKSKDGVPVYVSQGLGSHLLRVFARPQIIEITLKKGE